jgi:hypothetical protein
LGGKGNLPRRCEYGARHEETYLEIIDGLNKEKPTLAGSNHNDISETEIIVMVVSQIIGCWKRVAAYKWGGEADAGRGSPGALAAYR